MTDEDLMLAFIAGDGKAFDTLFTRHAPPLHGMLRRMTANDALAADLTQTTFLSVVRGRGRFVTGSRFKPWLYAIAVNALRDNHRRTQREVLSADGQLPDEGYLPYVRDTALVREVRAAVGRLPSAEMHAVVLHRFFGLSFAEIAALVAASESAVKVRAHRAYVALRKILHATWSSDGI